MEHNKMTCMLLNLLPMKRMANEGLIPVPILDGPNTDRDGNEKSRSNLRGDAFENTKKKCATETMANHDRLLINKLLIVFENIEPRLEGLIFRSGKLWNVHIETQ